MRTYLLFFVLLTLAACNSPKVPVKKANVSSILSAAGTDRVLGLLTKYYELKNALVATDALKVGDASTQLNVAVTMADTSLSRTDGKYAVELDQYFDDITKQCSIMAGISDLSCERQRLVFAQISADMYSLLKAVSAKNSGAYKQFCPMAFNNKGAYWLSDEDEIRNPYFGKKMLECGEVQDSL